MKKFKLFCILFAIYVTENYIVEDWSVITKLGKICLYPAWFARAVLIWLISPIFIPVYFFKQSKFYKQMKQITNSPEFQAQMAKSLSIFNF